MTLDTTSAVQTTFDAVYVIGQEGTLYSFQDELDALDAGTGHAGADLAFGRCVFSAAATPNELDLPASSADVARAVGVTLRSDYVGSGSTGYRAGQNVHIVRKGWVWAYALEAVNDQQQASVSIAVDANQGRFGVTADSTHIACNYARWRSTLGAAGIGLLEVNFSAGVAVPGPTGPTGATGPTGP